MNNSRREEEEGESSSHLQDAATHAHARSDAQNATKQSQLGHNKNMYNSTSSSVHSGEDDDEEVITGAPGGGFRNSPSMTNLAELVSEKQYLHALGEDTQGKLKKSQLPRAHTLPSSTLYSVSGGGKDQLPSDSPFSKSQMQQLEQFDETQGRPFHSSPQQQQGTVSFEGDAVASRYHKSHMQQQQYRADYANEVEPTGAFQLSTSLVKQGVSAVVDDSFTRCFVSSAPEAWNWNIYLFPAWVLGLFVRYVLLFPLRLLALLLGWTITLPLILMVKLNRPFLGKQLAAYLEAKLIQFVCSVFVMSWSGVVKFHGTRPTQTVKEDGTKTLPGVFVANHSSMIDFIILQQSHPYAVVGQKHPGWVGWCQEYLLGCLDPIWFHRGQTRNRKIVAKLLQEHAHDPDKTPLLVFPEGTCVNNEYVVQFKQAVFDLGVPINPVAIKYNKSYVDAYWNSRAQGFASHLFQLMTAWAVVCDVWYLDPMAKRENETASQFAKRVQKAIARRAGLKPVDWDGYMKYWKPSERFIKARQMQVADQVREAYDIPCPLEDLAKKEEVQNLLHTTTKGIQNQADDGQGSNDTQRGLRHRNK